VVREAELVITQTSRQRLITVASPIAELFLVVLLLGILWSGPVHADDDDAEFVNGEVIVKLNLKLLGPNTDCIATIADINRDYGTSTKDKLIEDPSVACIYLLQLPQGSDTEAVAGQMASDARLRYAEPNFTTEAPEGDIRHRARPDGSPTPSSDPAPYSDQYAVGALGLSSAHGISCGGNAVVAVLDTGVQPDHPVLANRLTAVRYDFVDDDPNPADEPNGRDDDADGEIDEVTGHGTHVAGIVHLTAPGAHIMPLRVLDSDGHGNVFLIAEAVQYAVSNGADVINLSLGSSQESELLEEIAEDLARDDDDGDDELAIEGVPPEGVIVAASAGNENVEAPRYPAAHEEGVLAVTSVDQIGVKSEFANFGSWVDIAAPGEGIYSTFPTSRYAYWDGTSMAAPFVTGQAALIRSMKPSWDPNAVESLIRNSARPLDALNPSHAGKLGAGHADIGASLEQLGANAECSPPSVTAVTPAPGTRTKDRTPLIRATVRDEQTNLAQSSVELYVDGRKETEFSYDMSTDLLRYNGDRLSYAWHRVKVVARDADGLVGYKGWSFKVVR
jgi:thermitase